MVLPPVSNKGSFLKEMASELEVDSSFCRMPSAVTALILSLSRSCCMTTVVWGPLGAKCHSNVIEKNTHLPLPGYTLFATFCFMSLTRKFFQLQSSLCLPCTCFLPCLYLNSPLLV